MLCITLHYQYILAAGRKNAVKPFQFRVENNHLYLNCDRFAKQQKLTKQLSALQET